MQTIGTQPELVQVEPTENHFYSLFPQFGIYDHSSILNETDCLCYDIQFDVTFCIHRKTFHASCVNLCISSSDMRYWCLLWQRGRMAEVACIWMWFLCSGGSDDR
jgi:hypothetical protein